MSADLQHKIIPNAIKKWNWGAFFLNVVWAVRHGVWFGLWMFVPVVNIFIPFVLAIKGNEWAWKKNNYTSEEDFLKSQRKWTISGLIIFITFILIFATLIWTLIYSINNSEVVKDIVYIMNNNNRISEFLGAPISKAGIGGKISFQVKDGIKYSSVRFNVKGIKKEALIDAELIYKNNQKIITNLSLVDLDNNKIVFINTSMKASINLDNKDILNYDSPIERVIKKTEVGEDDYGFLIIIRSEDFNDYMQIAIDRISENESCYKIEYSEGYTRENKNAFTAGNSCLKKSEILPLLSSYSSGSDDFKEMIAWKKLKELKEYPNGEIESIYE